MPCNLRPETPPTACQTEYTPFNTASAAEKWGKGEGNAPNKKQASELVQDVCWFLAHRSTRNLPSALPALFVNRLVQWICQRLQRLGQFKAFTFPPFFPHIKVCLTALLLNQAVGHKAHLNTTLRQNKKWFLQDYNWGFKRETGVSFSPPWSTSLHVTKIVCILKWE